MAEERQDYETQEVETQEETTLKKIQVVGPVDETNGAEVLRFVRDDGRRNPIMIARGQVLTVGDADDADITENEAQRLLNNTRWEAKEVEE